MIRIRYIKILNYVNKQVEVAVRLLQTRESNQIDSKIIYLHCKDLETLRFCKYFNIGKITVWTDLVSVRLKVNINTKYNYLFTMLVVKPFTSMDPYCYIYFGKQSQKTTPHYGGGIRPMWREVLKFALDNITKLGI